ncbi:MAG: GGDEF domain-containing protein [Proteobacteria bacterium]|nr:GGDEF domain-containing protein [Pseudomonadota bacterium]
MNRANSISPLGSGGSKKGHARDHGEEKRDKDEGEESPESPWEGTEAFAFNGMLADGLSPEIQKAFEELTQQIEPLRAEIERARGRESHFKELAETHAFLPLPGRREFFRELTHVLAHMEGLTTPSLIVLHLVNADDIRRRLGRNALDNVLVHVSSVIDTILESTDVAGSLGGNDFGIIQLVSDVTLARKKAEDMIQAVSANPFQWQGKTTPLDALAGVATLANIGTPEAALDAADKDLVGGQGFLSGEVDAPDAPPHADE